MTRIELEIHDDVIAVINKIKSASDDSIEIDIPEGSVIFDNVLNLKLLQKEGQKTGKNINYSTTDKTGLRLMSYVSGEQENIAPMQPIISSPEDGVNESSGLKRFPSIPAMPSLPKISLPKIGFKAPLAVVLIVGLVGTAGVTYIAKAPKAEVKIIVNSQPLIKSITVKTKNDTATSVEGKILKGLQLETTVTETASVETTGEKTVGTKAQGTVTIYNKTDSDKSFKKGATIGHKDFEYVLDEGVTVPARVDDPLDPTLITLGEAQVKVIASNIGEGYNLESGKNFEVKGYKTTEFVAVNPKKIEGGESRIVKIVSEEDLTALSSKTAQKSVETAQTALEAKLTLNQKLVKGSAKTFIASESFSSKAGEEADKVELTQTVKAVGLIYSMSDLEDMMDELVKDLVPDGYVTLSKDRDIQVEILGNSDTTVLTSEEADLQVTVKTFVVPDIEEEKLKEELAGKSFNDAQKILGGIRNIKTYELNVNPNIPFINKITKDTENIFVTIEKND